MGRSKKKKPKAAFSPKERSIASSFNPSDFYLDYPAWNFHTRDLKMWQFSEKTIGEMFWNHVLQKLCNWETMTWKQILSTENNSNHTIKPECLNKLAQNRLVELRIEAEGIMSLRLTGTQRLYGYMIGRVFNILWFDPNHGDNDLCVCRSTKKHT